MFLRSVIAALKGCTPSRSAVYLFALVLFLPSNTDAQAQAAPEITSGGPFTVAEGTTAVATLTASDEDTASDQLVWTIPQDGMGGADADKFTLSSTGVLAFSAVKDYENPDDGDGDRTYEITVQVSDNDNTVTADIRVTVENVIELATEVTGPAAVPYAENGATRVATYTASSEADRDGITWILTGDDKDHFSIDNPRGVLRFHIDPDGDNPFPKLPDYEAPDDEDIDNAYEVTVLAGAGTPFTNLDPLRVTVTVTDENEDGAISLDTARPQLGTAVRAMLSDPDEGSGTPTWQWERSVGRNTWVVIDGETAASYTPTAADTGAYLRVTADYTHSHTAGQSARAVSAEVVTAELLDHLNVTTATSTADPDRWNMRPAFSADILHYAVGCTDSDTMTLTFSAKNEGTRVAVNGVQANDKNATVEVPVEGGSDVRIILTTGSNGTSTTYVVHCMDSRNSAIERTIKEPGASTELISVYAQIGPGRQTHSTYLAIIDANGVPRWQRRLNRRATHFKAHPDGRYPYSYWTASQIVILDENLEEVERVATTPALTVTGGHDFAIRENGNYVFMAYEPAFHDFSAYTDEDDNPYSTTQATEDSVIEEVTPAERRAFFWNSWDHMYLNDCRQHRFPNDYAHINSVQVVDEADIIASFRGCSQVWRIDRETKDPEWLLGRSNRSDAEWEDLGMPAPLKIVGDPHGEFCGQHSARLIPNGHLLLFDNGNHCLSDPETGDTQRTNSEFSRVVEYALDPDNGEAVFVRDHCLGNDCDRFSISQGHIHRMDNGNWLISWGRGDDRSGSVLPLEASLTEVDPLTNEELLAFKITHPEYHNSEQVQPTRAYPVEFVALADTPGPLRAEIVESPASSAFHLGPTDAPKVVVAFSRPVVDPDPAATTWPSVSVTGATIAGISPQVAPGDPANAYLVTLTPTGVGPITFALVPGQSCASGGICTAGGTVLSEVPVSHVIPPRSTGPPVMSITSSGTHPTKDGFTVTITFSEPVTGLAANEIEVTKGAGSNFAGAGAVYTLDIAPDAGIEDDVTVTVTAGAVVGPLNNGNLAASAAFAVDTQAPVVSRVAITSNPGPDATYAPGDEMEVTVTFSETVVVTGTPRVTLKVGERDRSANYESVTGAVMVFAYTVAVNDSDTDGVSMEADSLSGGTIRDTARNNAVLTHSAVAADTGQKVDGIKPVLASTDGAVANGTMLTLAYSEPLDTSSAPGNDAFSVTGGNETRTVTGVRVSGSAVELTLDPAAEHEEAGITVSYTPGMNRLRDVAGNEAEALSQEPVTNDTPDTTSPTVSSVEITSNPPDNRDTYATGDVIEATVTFSETVMVTGTPRVTLKVGERDRSANYESVTGAVLVFAYTVAVNDSDTDGVSMEADSLSGGTIRDTARNNAVLTHSAVAADTGQKVDGIKPVLASTDGAVANGTMLTLAYSEPLDTSSAPGNDAFSVTGGNETRTVTGVRVSGSAAELTLTPAVEHGETGLRVSYTIPTGTGANPIQDQAGNDADRLSNRSVTNVTGDTTGPTVEMVRITSSAGSDSTYAVDDSIEVAVTFNETVVVTGTPRLTLNVGGQNRTAEYLSVSGSTVKFEYKVVLSDRDRDGVSIDANSLSRGSGTIRDGARNDATLTHAAVAADSRHKVDGVKPSLATTDGAVVNGTTLTLAYSEPLNSSSRPAASAFTVTGGNETRTVTRVQVSGNSVLLTLNPAVTDTESGLRLSYQPGDNPIEDTVGNAAEELNNEPVTNNTGDTTGPTVQTVRITSNAGSDQTYAAGETIEVTVTFDETVLVTGTPRLTLNVGGRSRTANYQDVTGADVRFEYKVVSGDSAAYGVSIEANRLSSGTIRDGAQNNAVLNHAPVAADSQHQVDGVKPTLASSDGAVVNGTTLTLVYGEPMDSSSVPSTDDFTVTGGSETRTVTVVRVDGSAVFLTLSSAVTDGESGLRVNYEPGSNPIQDTAGNDADRLSNKSVTNQTGDTAGPVVSMVAITSSAGSDRTYGVDETIEVTVTFDETLVVTGTPEVTLNVGGRNRTAEYRGVSNRAVKFTYRVVTGDNDEDGVSIEANRLSRSGGTIRDGAQNNATLDHTAVAASSSHKVDAVAPALAVTDPAVVNGTTLTLTYNEPLNTSSRPATSDFTLAGGNETRTVTRVQVTGSEVRLTVSPAAEYGETGIRVSYESRSNPIQDAIGNDAEAFRDEFVDNRTPDTTAPSIEGIEISSDPGTDETYAVDDMISVTVRYDET